MLITATQIRSTAIWVPVIEFCVFLNLKKNLITYISIFITDLTLLVIMLIGLLRLFRSVGGTGGLGLLLWKQVTC